MDWDELSASERQQMVGLVKVGGLVFEVHDDTDRLMVDFIADLPLAEWEWFFDSRGVGLGGHVQSLFDLRSKRPCQDLGSVDWARLQARVGDVAQAIVEQSRKSWEADSWKLYLQSRGVEGQERPWRHMEWRAGLEAAGV